MVWGISFMKRKKTSFEMTPEQLEFLLSLSHFL